MVLTLSGSLVILLGMLIGIEGAWLVSLGGSFGYLVLGLALLGDGVLLVRRHRFGLIGFAVILLLAAGWAVWSVGLDYWALVPRLALLEVIGIWLLMPWVVKAFGADAVDARRPGRAGLAVAVLIVGVTAIVASAGDPYDIAANETVSPAPPTRPAPSPAGTEWSAYGGTLMGQRHSTLPDITPANVGTLALRWTFHTGDLKRPGDPGETTFELTPLKIGDSLYLCTPHNHVIALDATTGRSRWEFDPKIRIDNTSEHLTCRGVGYHDDAAPAPACAQRIVTSTMDARLIELDAHTGRPCDDFGEHGVVSLWANMPNVKAGAYMPTSAPLVTKDLIVIGGAVNDNVRLANPSGVVRAFDVHTGKLVWNWDPGRPDQTTPIAADATYSAGAPNMWSAASADEALGLVYVPLGNKSPDQYGADRSAEVERFSSAIVALDLHSGQVRWVRQTVHHDLWDRDVPSQPSLVDLPVNGGVVPALVGPTKQGDLFVLDRRTGEPIVPVREVPVPAGAVAGDHTAPTQPVSALSFTPPPLTENAMCGVTPVDQLLCMIKFHSLRYEGRDTPPSLQGTIVYPGNTGVFNWGGVAVDPERHAVVGAALQLAFIQQLIPRPDATSQIATQGAGAFGENYGGPYAAKMGPFLSVLKLPCQQPPWGALVSADLVTGQTLWRHRNGTVRDQLGGLPLPFKMGVPSLGGPLITAGGVVFYSGTTDNYLRAYDTATGVQLWESRLPAGGQATPMSYRAADGKQMVVVAAGGHGSFGTTLGDAVLAYSLP